MEGRVSNILAHNNWMIIPIGLCVNRDMRQKYETPGAFTPGVRSVPIAAEVYQLDRDRWSGFGEEL